MFKNLSEKLKVIIYCLGVLLLALVFSLAKSSLFLTLFYMTTPALTTALLLFVITRDGYKKAGLKQLGLHHLGIKQWLLAVLVPFFVLLAGYTTVWIWSPKTLKFFPGGIKYLNSAVFILGVALYQTLTVSLAEEIGWRGYLLPKLVPFFGRIKSYVFIGALWALWHYPLIFISGVYNTDGNKLLTTSLFTLTLIPLSAILGELRLRGDSVWPASLFHSMHNTVWQFFVTMSVPSPLLVYVAGETGFIPLVLYSLVSLYMVSRTFDLS